MLYAYYILLGIISTVGIFRYQRLIPAQKIIGVIVLLTLAVELLNSYFTKYYHNNLCTSHIYTPLLILMLLWAFEQEYRLPKRIKIPIFSLTILLSVFNALAVQPLQSHFNSNGLILQTIFTVILFLVYANLVLERKHTEKIYAFPLLIFLSAQSLFNIHSLIFLGLFNYFLHNNMEIPSTFFRLHLYANMLLYGVVLMSFFVHQSISKRHA